ncbi:MAG: prepilin-type N-terminal cleavage/methylation domain-containing protein [Desulfobacterales bacterium]
MGKRRSDCRGFTLVELMVTLAVSGLALAGIYGAYRAQLESHVTQNIVVDTQQNLRNAFYILQRSLRMAGFDPTLHLRSAEAADGKLRRGFFGRFTELCEDGRVAGTCAAGYPQAKTGEAAIAFTSNETASRYNGTECRNTSPDLVPQYPANDLNCIRLEALDSELVAFRLEQGMIQRWGGQSGWHAIAENIESLSFDYLDDNLQPLTLPTDPGDEDAWRVFNENLRTVGITIRARPVGEHGSPLVNSRKDDFQKPRTFTAQVRIRNLGIR